jgi:hypothetical protein
MQKEWGKGMTISPCKVFLFTLESYFYMPHVLLHGASGFISPPKEGVLRIFFAFKNPSPWPL